MKVFVSNLQKDLSISKTQVVGLVEAFFDWKKVSVDEVSLTFVTKKKNSSLHKNHFNDPSPTDCISFPIDLPGSAPYTLLGELFICPEAALEYAPEEPYLALSLYIVHGLLHLLGYDDIDPKDRESMRKEERAAINSLKKNHKILYKLEKS